MCAKAGALTGSGDLGLSDHHWCEAPLCDSASQWKLWLYSSSARPVHPIFSCRADDATKNSHDVFRSLNSKWAVWYQQEVLSWRIMGTLMWLVCLCYLIFIGIIILFLFFYKGYKAVSKGLPDRTQALKQMNGHPAKQQQSCVDLQSIT